MKKLLVILGMITCIFGLTACASKEVAEETPILTDEEAKQTGEQFAELVASLYQSGTIDQYSQVEGYAVLKAAVDSMDRASKDMGSYVGIIGSEAEVDSEQAVISVTIEGTERNAVVEVILSQTDIEAITTNVEYTFGELMQKAGLNTLLGMGTVFSVLILISIIISLFRFISVFENRKEKKQVQEAAPVAVTPAVAETTETSEELSDDLELVAVIAAAIAASEGAASADGFVVRSIRKANKNKWQNA